MQGRVAGVRTAISTASAPVGIILGGLLAQFYGVTEIFLAFGFTGILILLLFVGFTSMRFADSEDNLVVHKTIIEKSEEVPLTTN